jgi:hypothetical protein
VCPDHWFFENFEETKFKTGIQTRPGTGCKTHLIQVPVKFFGLRLSSCPWGWGAALCDIPYSDCVILFFQCAIVQLKRQCQAFQVLCSNDSLGFFIPFFTPFPPIDLSLDCDVKFCDCLSFGPSPVAFVQIHSSCSSAGSAAYFSSFFWSLNMWPIWYNGLALIVICSFNDGFLCLSWGSIGHRYKCHIAFITSLWILWEFTFFLALMMGRCEVSYFTKIDSCPSIPCLIVFMLWS